MINNNIKTNHSQQARDLGLTVRTYRRHRQKQRYLDIIAAKINNDDLYNSFINAIDSIDCKTCAVSLQQLEALSNETTDTIIDILKEIAVYPNDARWIIRGAVAMDERLSVLVPSWVSQHFTNKAEEKNMSKADYLKELLTQIAD